MLKTDHEKPDGLIKADKTPTSVVQASVLNTTTMTNEVSQQSLEITGSIPDWLDGVLLRTGPAKFNVNEEEYCHLFDGLAMLHRYEIRNGQVIYSNKMLGSNAYNATEQSGHISYREFGTDPCKAIFKNSSSEFLELKFTDNANINISRIDKEYVALTETPLPVVFDFETLQTKGHLQFKDSDEILQKAQITTAHPHFDYAANQQINYITHLSGFSKYVVYSMDSDSATRKIIGACDVVEPSYMHSFALTKNYIILTTFPLVVTPSEMTVSGKPFIENYRWRPLRGTKFIIMSRKDGSVLQTIKTSAFFSFHHVNAFEDSDDMVIIDSIDYKDPSIINDLYLDVLRGKHKKTVSVPPQLRRHTIDLAGTGFIKSEVLSEQPIELPRINYKENNMKEYQFIYAVGGSNAEYSLFDKIIKIDLKESESKSWSDDNCYPGEPIFVENPRKDSEDDGVVLSIILDTNTEKSFLLLLDAQSFVEIGRAQIPHHIPASFHGQFFRG